MMRGVLHFQSKGGYFMEGISRRDFLKTTSVSAAGASMMSLGQLSSAFGFKKKRASRVVIAKDEDCIGDQAKVQDMVDYSIMNLTGETDKGKAYEALFDSNLTTSSKILIKYNNSRTDTDNLVLKALVNGLTSMFNGTFPELPSSQLIGRATGDASNQTFETQGTTYAIRDIWVDCDYFINMPSAWAMNAPTYPGVTMSLKAMFPVVSGSLSRMHNNFTDEDDPPLSVLCSKIRDLLGGTPGGKWIDSGIGDTVSAKLKTNTFHRNQALGRWLFLKHCFAPSTCYQCITFVPNQTSFVVSTPADNAGNQDRLIGIGEKLGFFLITIFAESRRK